MKIEDSFRVDVPVEEAWKVLLDVERIAPCLPGAQLTEIEGEEYRGVVKVKVGPITAQYKGAAKLDHVEESAHTLTIRAMGRDTRGQGNASATIAVAMADDGGGTRVDIDTDLAITGKVAQFGRGILADVSAKLLAQFVGNLERDVLGRGSDIESHRPESEEQTPAETAGPRLVEAPEPEPVDLLETAVAPFAKRLLPAIGLLLIVVLVWRLLRRDGPE